jgi:hypothetical protein
MRRGIVVAVALVGFLVGFIPIVLTTHDVPSAPRTSAVGYQPGALPGQLVPVWSSRTYAGLAYGSGTSNAAARLYTVNSSFVVTPSDGSGLAVRDTRTGRLMDEIQPEPGWTFDAQQVVGDQLYAFLDEGYPDPVGRIVNYDLRTGLVRWHVDLTGVDQIPQGYDPVIATPRDVIAQLPDGVAYGFLASSGRQSWTYRPPADCDVFTEADGLGTGGASGTANASGTVAYLLRCDVHHAPRDPDRRLGPPAGHP